MAAALELAWIATNMLYEGAMFWAASWLYIDCGYRVMLQPAVREGCVEVAMPAWVCSSTAPESPSALYSCLPTLGPVQG